MIEVSTELRAAALELAKAMRYAADADKNVQDAATARDNAHIHEVEKRKTFCKLSPLGNYVLDLGEQRVMTVRWRNERTFDISIDTLL